MLHLPRESCSSQSSCSFDRQKRTSPMRKGTRRPLLIDTSRQLAAYFACCVTTESTNTTHWVAKNGESSLFKTLQRMLPEVSSLIVDAYHISLFFSIIAHKRCQLMYVVDWFRIRRHQSMLTSICLQITQNEEGRHRLKSKISGVEFNKLVQSECGFVCARTRKQRVARYVHVVSSPCTRCSSAR
jgi:hypothetical protein